MNKDQIKGSAENLKGRAKEAVGAATGNRRTEVKGAIERAKGAIQAKVGDVEQNIAREGKKSQDE